MPTTRKKVIKTVYKDDDSEGDEGGDFSDSGSDAVISEASEGSESEVEEFSDRSSGNEFVTKPPNKSQSKSSKLRARAIKQPKALPRKTTFAREFISKVKKTALGSDEEIAEQLPTFSVKDLTEAEKLLPSVLNLSESDSSDDESPKASCSKPNISISSQNYDSDCDRVQNEYQDVFSGTQEDSEEIAKKTFLELEKHKKHLEETKASLEKYSTLNTTNASITDNSMELDVKDLLAQGEDPIPESNPVKKIRKKKRHDSDSEMEDWEEVKEKSIPQQGIQLIVDFPDAAARKAKKIDVEMMMRRKINRVKKEYQVYMHKVHVLCWLGHGNYISRVLNDQDIMAAALSLVPSKECYPGERIDMKYLEQITTWYKDKLTLKQDKHEDKFRPKAPPLKEILASQIKNRVVTTKKYIVYIFVSLLRALGLQCRVMINFVTLPIKPPTSELCSLSTKQKDKESDAKSKDKVANEKSKSKAKCSKSKAKLKGSVPQLDGNYDSSDSCESDIENIMQVDGNDDSSIKTRTRAKSKPVSKVDENIMQVDGNDDSPVKTRTRAKSKPISKADDKDIENEDVSPPKRSKLSLSLAKDNKTRQSNTRNSRATKKTAELEKKEIKSLQELKAQESKSPSRRSKRHSPSPASVNKTNNKLLVNNVEDDINKSRPLKTTKIPKILVTNEKGEDKISSDYFARKSLSLNRNRSQTTTPSTSKTNNTELTADKSKARTRSAPRISAETSEFFQKDNKSKAVVKSVRQRKQKESADSQRVSHRDLMNKNKSPKKDITGDLVDIIKKRVKEAKVESMKGIVKGKQKPLSDDDSDHLPETIKKRRVSDSDTEFKPTKISPKPKTLPAKKKIDRRVLSSDDDAPKNKIDVWCEVFVEELEQWISVDVIKGTLHCPSAIYGRATHPVTYVVGWDNNNYLKDLTRRYVPHWNTVTRKQRAEPAWWTTAIGPWKGPRTARDREEDQQLDNMQLEAPLPKSIAEYKNHPLYALQRHLLKFEAIYPADAATLGFVRGEPVYARDCVYTCRSRDTWLKEAKVVKLGEKPYKVVKARPKWDKLSNKVISDLPLEVFGPWQVKDYEPPQAENGVVPRNAYGNVELFKQCMLPKGTVHIKLPGLNKVARKLNIDCAPAMTGFDFNGGYTHPVFDGFVVCQEFEEIITEAWLKDQEEQERREKEKLEARVYGNWKRLIKGLFIRERLKDKYGFEEPSSTKENKKTKGPRLVCKKK